MAKINNVEIKNLKSYIGREGVAYQGDVWYNGKKLGFWSQDGNGAICDTFYFDESLLDKPCQDFYEGFPDSYKYKKFCKNKEVFLNQLVLLKQDEKGIKKMFKKGFPSVIFVTDGFHSAWMGCKDSSDDAFLLKDKSSAIEKMKEGMFKNVAPAVHIFRPDGFDITVNKDNPAPNIFMV